jgi:hypothetical protein
MSHLSHPRKVRHSATIRDIWGTPFPTSRGAWRRRGIRRRIRRRRDLIAQGSIEVEQQTLEIDGVHLPVIIEITLVAPAAGGSVPGHLDVRFIP